MPTRRSRRSAAVLLVAIAATTPALARADGPPSEAEASIQRGVDLRREGRNGEALVEFQKAFAIEPSPRARAQVALALQAIGDWLGAERWLNEALRATDDAWIARYHAELAGALATIQAHLGSLRLRVDAAESQVLINGSPAPTLLDGAPIRVVAGAVDVVVRARGRLDVHRVIDVAAGAEVSEVVATEPATAPPEVAEQSSVAPPATRSAPIGGYVAMASAGTLAIGGVAAWAIHQSAASTWNDDSRCLLANGENRGQQCGGYQRTANVALGLEIGAFAAAAVGAGLGVWLLWPRRTAAPTAAWCAPSGPGIACGGAF